MTYSPSIGVVLITHNSKKHLLRCLPPLIESPIKPQILVVNSSSNDGTVELAEHLGAKVFIVPRNEFNHGKTREIARHILNTEIVAMMTPDAYLIDEHAFGKLVCPIINGVAEAVYARQIPHRGADFFEAFPREFNYPEEGYIRNASDVPRFGADTYFFSNSCAAYLNKSLDAIGGFSEVLLGEDTLAVAKLIHEGYNIAYAADALVHHSHSYSLKQEFCRSFDTGVARKEIDSLIKASKGDRKRGFCYAKEMCTKLLLESPLRLPYGIAHLFVKWLGYQIGSRSEKAPQYFKKALSSQDFYWTSHK